MTPTGLPPAELSLALRVLTPANRCDLAILRELTRLYVVAGEPVPDPLRRYVAEPPALNRQQLVAFHDAAAVASTTSTTSTTSTMSTDEHLNRRQQDALHHPSDWG